MKKNNVETKQIFDISSLNSNLTKDLLVDSLLAKDIWYAEEDLGLRINQHQRRQTINFGKIQQPWLKKRFKQYIVYRRIQGIAYSTINESISIFNRFSLFLAEQYINNFEEIDDNILELAIKEIRRFSCSYQESFICYIKGFLEFGNENKWFSISAYPLAQAKTTNRKRTKIQYIPDEVLQQLDKHLHLLPEPQQRLVILIRALGLRAGEILQLKFDCLRQRRNGNWEIEFINWKFKEQLDRLPINDDLVALIKQQQNYIRSNLNNDFTYLFSANEISLKSEKQGLFQVRPVSKVMALSSFNRYLQELAKHCQIKDKSGQNWHFTSHQFRRTVATKMTNEQVRQYIIQCYLRHKSLDMLQHYAQLLPDTMKEEMKEFRKKKKVVDITGREVEQIHSELDNDIGLQWLRAKMQPKALAMGFCARPALLKPCPHANACMSCEHFRLDKDDLPALKQHLKRNEQLKKESQQLGFTRQIKSLEQDEARLNKLIKSLSNSHE
jgi:integrase/recombinase XerD